MDRDRNLAACLKRKMCADRTVPQFIDPVFAKTSPKSLFLMTENERFGLVFAKTGSINSGTETVEKKFVIMELETCQIFFLFHF